MPIAFSVFSLNMILIICFAAIVQQCHDMHFTCKVLLLLIRFIRMNDGHCFDPAANFTVFILENIIYFLLVLKQNRWLVHLSGRDALLEHYTESSCYHLATFWSRQHCWELENKLSNDCHSPSKINHISRLYFSSFVTYKKSVYIVYLF